MPGGIGKNLSEVFLTVSGTSLSCPGWCGRPEMWTRPGPARSVEIERSASSTPKRSLTFADAILDRIVHNACHLELKGTSMRKTIAKMDDETPQT